MYGHEKNDEVVGDRWPSDNRRRNQLVDTGGTRYSVLEHVLLTRFLSTSGDAGTDDKAITSER